MRNSHTVSGDRADEKCVRAVVRTMGAFGGRLKFRLFERQVAPADMVRLRGALDRVIHRTDGQIRFIDLGSSKGRGHHSPVTHPLFDYRVSYRRLLEIQVRLLARVVEGEIGDYPVFVTR